jgi:hypothetical protein
LIGDILHKKQVPFAFPFSGKGVGRLFLQELRSRHSEIGYIFDTLGMRKDEDFIIQRVEADYPDPNANGNSNLPRYFYNAYQEAFVASIS